jgi:hypothetical protein
MLRLGVLDVLMTETMIKKSPTILGDFLRPKTIKNPFLG